MVAVIIRHLHVLLLLMMIRVDHQFCCCCQQLLLLYFNRVEFPALFNKQTYDYFYRCLRTYNNTPCWPLETTLAYKHSTITRETYASWHMQSRSQKPREQIRRTVTRRFNQNGEIFKKVAERPGNSVWWSRDRRPTVEQRSSTFQAIRKQFEKSRWTVTRQWSEVTRPLAGCQTTLFLCFEQFGKFLKKVTEWSRDSGRRSRDRRPTVEQRFLDVSSNLKFFWKKSLNGHATVVGGHATVGRLSNNDFCTFQAIRNFFEKSHWTVTRQWSEVTRPSADCQAHICMNKRERGRERLSPLHFIRAPPCCAVGRFISRRPGWG